MRGNLPTRVSRQTRRISLAISGLAFVVGSVLMLPAVLGQAPIPPAQPAPQPTSRAVGSAPEPIAQPVPTLYMIGYAHLDTQWRWSYPEVIGKMIPATMRDNLALLEKYPDITFNFAGSRRYQMMKEYYPAEFARVKAAVAAGRWFPCGSSVDENDVNVPAAESIIRHVLYGNHWFRQELGTASEEYMLPDCFGFPASLPSILAHCGIKGFSTQKLSWRSAVGIPFAIGVWEGLSGESVIAALDAKSYTSRIKEDLSKSQEWLKFTREYGERYGVPYAFLYYGSWGDEGGGLTEESAKFVQQAVSARGPLKVIAPHADQLFKDITPAQQTKLPRFKGDMLLKEHSAGGLTSAAYMKRWNRHNELLADAAERASTFAAWLGGAPYPQKRLNDAWTLTLGSQMHDILPGTCLPKGYEYAWNDELLAINQFAGVLESAVASVATCLDTRAKGVPLVVYNPLAIEREDVVEARVTFPDRAPTSVQVFGPDGSAVSSQVLDSQDRSVRVLFLARLPSVGFAVYDVRPADGAAVAASILKVSEQSLENDRYRVAIDSNGDVASVTDKSETRELLASPARLAFQGEAPREWPAWNMDWADRQLPPKGFVGGPARIRVVESGPVRVAVEITREAEESRFVQVVRLAAGDGGNRVEFTNDIHWQSQGYALKATFPLAVSNPRATYNWEVGTLERGNNDPNKFEVPSHQWFDLTDVTGDYGVTVLSDCKYGSDKPDDRTLRLTLIYTPLTKGRGEYQDQGWQDWGRHDIRYGLAGHPGDWRKGRTDWQALRLNQPSIAFQTEAHEGDLGKTASLLKVSSPSVRVLAVKKAEDSSETIVRIVELDGRTQKGVRITLAAPVAAAREVNGQEQPLGDALVDRGEVLVDIEPYRARAFALKLGAAPAKAIAARSAPIEIPLDRCVTSTDGHALGAGAGLNAEARSLPAEMLPAEIAYRSIAFKLGPLGDDRANAATCRGQVLDLPAGEFNRVYLLAAASGDRKVTFQVDGKPIERTIQGWGGYLGQWDTRIWNGEPAAHTYSFPWQLAGLKPAFLRADPVAWFCSHHHDAKGENRLYEYCYLFACSLDLPTGARRLTLPTAEDVFVLAATIARDPAAATWAAQPLMDELRREGHAGPRITPNGGAFSDATEVCIRRGFFGTESDIRYTLDGSDPTAESPVYRGPIILHQETTVKARSFVDGTGSGTISEARLAVHDGTPPSIRSVQGVAGMRDVFISFSEALDKASAEIAKNYKLSAGPAVASAKLAGESKVVLTLTAPLPAGATEVTLVELRDRAPKPNIIAPLTIALKAVRPIETIDAFESTTTARLERPIAVEKITDPGAPWTINFWLNVPKQPDDLTIIAGFGSCDDRMRGAQRFLIKFPQGLHFWGSNVDVTTGVPLEVGRWQMLTAAFDGHTLKIYKDARLLLERPIELSKAKPVIKLGEKAPWPDRGSKLVGSIARFTLWNEALDASLVEVLHDLGPGQ